MYIVNPVSNSQTTGASTIDFSVWVSGAEDFEVNRPEPLWDGYKDGTGDSLQKNGFVGNMAAETSIVTVTDMRALFRTPFETLVPAKTSIPTGVQMGEHVDSWPELLHRYSFNRSFNATSGVTNEVIIVNPWTKNPVSLFDVRQNWMRVWRSFLFVRGGYRLKVLPMNIQLGDPMNEYMIKISNVRFDASSAMHPSTPDDVSMADLGMILENASLRPIVEAEIPFYTPWNMICDGYALEQFDVPCAYISINGSAGNASPQAFAIYISASDSTSFGWPTTPVVLLRPNSVKEKDSKTAIPIAKGGNLPQTAFLNPRNTIRSSVSSDNNNTRDRPLD
jgi:hypothetical protein